MILVHLANVYLVTSVKKKPTKKKAKLDKEIETKGSNPEMQILEIIWNYTKIVKQNSLL